MIVERDGCFDDGEMYCVLSSKDVNSLITALESCK